MSLDRSHQHCPNELDGCPGPLTGASIPVGPAGVAGLLSIGPVAVPFHGYVVWLTADQGGRSSGPLPPLGQDFAATAYVPPATAQSGLASIVLRVSNRTAWRSAADARRLVVDNVPPHRVGVGDLIGVTEGARTVAHFHVEDIDAVVYLVTQQRPQLQL